MLVLPWESKRRAAGWLGELLRQRHKAPSRLLADWRGVLALVRSLEHGHEDVFGAVRRLRRLYEAEARVARPPVAAGDAVSLITVHGAKGLEWPVVILPNLQRPWRPGGEKVRVNPEHGVSLEFDDGTPALHRALAERAARVAEAEERRILYVAMTRARDRLVLCCTGTRRGSAAEWLTPGLQRLGIDWRPFLPGT